MDIDRPSDRAATTEYSLLSKRTNQVLETGAPVAALIRRHNHRAIYRLFATLPAMARSPRAALDKRFGPS